MIVLALGIVSVGCGTVSKKPNPEAQTSAIIEATKDGRVYRMDYDRTFRSSVDVLRRLDQGSARLVRYDDGIIIFQRSDESEVTTVTVTKLDDTSTRVNLSAKVQKKYWFDSSDDSVAQAFFEELDRRLNSLAAPMATAEPAPPAQPSPVAEVKDEQAALQPVAAKSTVEVSVTSQTPEPPQEQAPPENTKEKEELLSKLGQSLQLSEGQQFLQKLSYDELLLLESRVESLQKTLEKQGEINGKCAACYIDLARAYHDSAQYARAAEALRTAISVDPNNAVAHCNLGEIYKHLDLVDDAVRELNTAQKLNPELADVYINLGILYDDYLKDDQKALEYYQRYMALGGTDQQVVGWISAIKKGS